MQQRKPSMTRSTPERQPLDKAESNGAVRLGSLHERRERRDSWIASHPEAARRLNSIDHEIETLNVVVDRPSPGVTVGRGASRDWPWLREAPVRDRGLDLGLGR